MLTYSAFVGAAVFTIFLLYVMFGRGRGLDAQLVADRKVPFPFVGCWLAVAFTWGATFFFSGQTAYQHGLAGFSWYALGNGGGLALVMLLMLKMGAPRGRYSIAQVMEERYGQKTKMLYAVSVVGIQAGYALTLQFLAAASLLQLTANADRTYTILVAAAAMIVPVLIGGIRSSASLDLLKGAMMATLIIVLAPLAVHSAGGLEVIAGGLAGTNVSAVSFFDWNLMSGFGVPIFVSLISAGPIDQSLFQRYFSATRGPVRWMKWVMVAGVIFFVLNMIAAASLGFLAANPSLQVMVSSPRIAGFAAMKELLPTASVFFMITVIAAFTASGDAALNASSSIWAIDIYKRWWRPEATERQVMLVQRFAMAAFIVIAAAVALTGVDMLSMVIAVGVFRSSLFIPTVVGFFTSKERVPDVFVGTVFAMFVSVWLFSTGHTFAGSLAGWAITGMYCLYTALKSRRPASHAA